MKRIFAVLILSLILVAMLTSCGIEAPPKIKEGRFHFSVTYEQYGEVKTVSGVYVCEYAGYSFSLEGGKFTRSWEGHVEGIEHADEVYHSTVLICTTDDGGEIFLSFDLGAAHMMGEPYFADVVIEPCFFLVYSNEDHTVSEYSGGAEEIEERYGFKIVDYRYDSPIENSFGLFN